MVQEVKVGRDMVREITRVVDVKEISHDVVQGRNQIPVPVVGLIEEEVVELVVAASGVAAQEALLVDVVAGPVKDQAEVHVVDAVK